MPHSDPTRESSIPGISEPKAHSPNVFAAPDPNAPASSHHPAPAFATGLAPTPDWPAILDELPCGLVVLGPKQELRHENAACRQLTGYGVAEKGGVEGWLSALCPDPGHREQVIASWREHIWRNQLTRTFTLRTVGQKPKEIEFRSSLLRDGGITLTLDDVTEARRAEEASRHGKWKFRALFTHTRTGSVLVDRTGRIIDANPAFAALCGSTLKELRLSTLAGLLHPDEADALAEAEDALLREWDGFSSRRSVERETWLRTRSGEKRTRLVWCPVGEPPEPPAMGLYLFEPLDPGSADERLKARLRTVSRKAQALLQAVPDLILLIEADGTVADYSPPPQPWPELSPDDSWRQRPAAEVWPVLGNLLEQCRSRLFDEGRVVHADLRGRGEDSGEFSITLSPCGDGQLLAVVRRSAEARPEPPSAAPAPPPRERRQHGFRNQLQLVTSLFSLEPQSAAAREAFLKWQVRLRSMALACPYDDSGEVWVLPLLRDLADAVCSLVGRGPGRREVIVTGDEGLALDTQMATSFALLAGELMRLVLATRQPGPGPELYANLRPHPGGGFSLAMRPGTHRRFVFTDRDAEIETLELLSEQIQGRIEATDAESPSKEWVLVVPRTRP